MEVETAVYPSPFAIFAISLAFFAGYSFINSLIAAGVLVFFFMVALSSSVSCRQASFVYLCALLTGPTSEICDHAEQFFPFYWLS
jgi:hypothetical protein